jgi:hypothetical protein
MMKTLLKIFFSGIFMSFAWPLRGQFGHMEGALIPGAIAAASISILIPQEAWRKSFAQAVILGALGFSIGGDFGYGKLINTILAAPDLWAMKRELAEIFLIGAIWGGIGMTMLGFAFSEKLLDIKDRILFGALGTVWWILSSFLKLDAYNLLIYGGGLLILHFHNILIKKSGMPAIFGALGILGFGGGFLLSVIILYYGNHGKIPGNWWSLRDQIWGLCGGFSVLIAARICVQKNLQPNPISAVSVERYGFVIYAVLIPAIETYNVFQKWFFAHPPVNPFLWPAIFMGACGLTLTGILIVLLGEDQNIFEEGLNQTLFRTSVFFMIYLSAQAILKSIVYSGMQVWETAFTLFIVESILLSVVAGACLKR